MTESLAVRAVRRLTVAAVAILAVAGLAGCRTNVGTAATVNGHRFSESDVTTYLTRTGPAASASAAAKANNQEIEPRVLVLQTLVSVKVYEATLARNGGLPSNAQLASYHDAAAKLLLQSQQTGDQFDKSFRSVLVADGIRTSLLPQFNRQQELEYTLINRLKLTQLSGLVAAVRKAKVHVSVSARYGTWDVSTLSVSDAGRVPSFLKLRTTAAAAPSGATG